MQIAGDFALLLFRNILFFVVAVCIYLLLFYFIFIYDVANALTCT